MKGAQGGRCVVAREDCWREGEWCCRYLVCTVVVFFVLIGVVGVIIGGFQEQWRVERYAMWVAKDEALGKLCEDALAGEFLAGGDEEREIMVATGGLQLSDVLWAGACVCGREVIFSMILCGVLFRVLMEMLPLYIPVRDSGVRNYCRAIFQELEDATSVDGGSTIDFFWRIVVPLAGPLLAVVSMVVMVTSWNSFLLPLVVLNDSRVWRITMGVMQLQGEDTTDLALTLAYISLAMVLAIILSLVGERHCLSGVTTGAVKG